MRKYALCIAALCYATVAAAQTGRSPSVSTPNSLKWGPAPSILPAGAKLAVLDGDPMKSGAYTMRLMMPPGYRIPPHFHHADEHVTVISGALNVGMGDNFTTKGGNRAPLRDIRNDPGRRPSLRLDQGQNDYPASRSGAVGTSVRQRC